ncbi:hypothetical protein [Micromonospora aurantiaca (nom. illeg.)]|uniref:hypothetical protein n=1 Tax=Micromonospora aurantiaca (nom. illeg.) TaxID=47850 RepID=UPI003F4A5F3B
MSSSIRTRPPTPRRARKFDEDTADPAEADHGNPQAAKGLLAELTEAPRPPIVQELGRTGAGGRPQANEVVARDNDLREVDAGPVGQPQVTGGGVGSKDQSAAGEQTDDGVGQRHRGAVDDRGDT